MKSLLLAVMFVSGWKRIYRRASQDFRREAENKTSQAVRTGKIRVLSAGDRTTTCGRDTKKRTKFQEWSRSHALLAQQSFHVTAVFSDYDFAR